MFLLYCVVMGGSAGILFGDAADQQSRFGRYLRYGLSVALMTLAILASRYMK